MMKQRKKMLKIKKIRKINIIKEFNLNSDEIKKIIEEKNYKTPIIHIDEETNIKTIYQYKSTSPNYIYYVCKLRNKYPGGGKVDIKNNKFCILYKCDIKIEHEYISYKEFKDFYQKNKTKEINLKKNIYNKI